MNNFVTALLPSLSQSLAEQFNIFRVMHHGTHEKQLSNVFVWLLDADATHEFGDKVQRAFLIRPGNNGDSEATERTSLSCPKRSTPSSYANEQSAWSSTPSKLTLVPAAASSAGSATNSV
ncbi:PD-(D/E)XK nuclease family protein [Brevibacterium aurantiacum]